MTGLADDSRKVEPGFAFVAASLAIERIELIVQGRGDEDDAAQERLLAEVDAIVEALLRAAARGGFTAVFAMANTQPAQDNQMVTDSVWRIGREVGLDPGPVVDVRGVQGRRDLHHP